MKIIVQFRIGNYIVQFYFRLLLYLFSLFFFCLKHDMVWRAEGPARTLFEHSRAHVWGPESLVRAFLYVCEIYVRSKGSVVTYWA